MNEWNNYDFNVVVTTIMDFEKKLFTFLFYLTNHHQI